MEIILGKPSATLSSSSLYQCRAGNSSTSYEQQAEINNYYYYNYAYRKAFKECMVQSKYQLLSRIGNGAFGMIYEGICIKSRKKVAIKIELKSQTNYNSLQQEYQILRHLQGIQGIPQVFWFGQEGGFSILIMELLGSSIDQLHKEHGREFSVMTLALVIDKMIDRIRDMHEKHVIHRDLKPENFLIKEIGEEEEVKIYDRSKSTHSEREKRSSEDMFQSPVPTKFNSVIFSKSKLEDTQFDEHLEQKTLFSQQVFIIDFGLAKFYVDQNTGLHIPQRQKTHFVGTASFSSRNSHELIEQSRRDDMESLANVMIYLKKGKLPWLRKLNLNVSRRKRYEMITKRKLETRLEDITEGLPEELKIFYQYCCEGMEYEDRPDYGYLKGLLYSMVYKQYFGNLLCFQWQITPKLMGLQEKIQEYKNEMLKCRNSLVSIKSGNSEEELTRKQTFDMLSLRSPPPPTIEEDLKSESYRENTILNSSGGSAENTDESNNNDNAGLIHKNPFISPDKKPLTLKRVTAFQKSNSNRNKRSITKKTILDYKPVLSLSAKPQISQTCYNIDEQNENSETDFNPDKEELRQKKSSSSQSLHESRSPDMVDLGIRNYEVSNFNETTTRSISQRKNEAHKKMQEVQLFDEFQPPMVRLSLNFAEKKKLTVRIKR